MGTRSRIGVVNNDGTVISIYCHWDGYPSGVGKVLLENYTDLAKVAALMVEGDCSSLGPEIGSKHNFDGDRPTNESTFYRRDRGEPDVDAVKNINKGAFFATCTNTDAEYAYLFNNGAWEAYNHTPGYPFKDYVLIDLAVEAGK